MRVSRRAKRIRLAVSPREGLVVTVPRRADIALVPGVLRDHARWIERASARVAERRAHVEAAEGPLPERIEAPGIGAGWSVRLEEREGVSGVTAADRDGEVVLRGAVADTAACREALRRWTSQVARRELVPMLEHLAPPLGVRPARVQLRAQRTRWGSASARGTVSLNRNLVFLAPDLVRYVLLHELTHLRVADHSPAFWRELEKHVADAGPLRARLREAWRDVPPWAAERPLEGTGR